MNKVTINRKELLDIVNTNLKKHITEYKEAKKDYIDAVLVICKNNLELAKYGAIEKFRDIDAIPMEPNSYENDYKKTIRMLELSVDKNITLAEHEFSELVLDNWNWKTAFVTSNSMYKTLRE